jgi:hypothetical protein
VTAMADLQTLTDDLETLYLQEIDGEPVDLDLRDRTQATLDTLDDSDWWVIATELWPDKAERTIEDLEMFLSWVQDSPIWVRSAGRRTRRRRRGDSNG